MSLRDLDGLIISCRTDETRAYVSEAVACYKAGAFRACIVATWIAVVYDLLVKIRELSLAGDSEAQRITTELENLQPCIERDDQGATRRILEIERNIVDVANNKFGFFEGRQVLNLTRLRDDRNVVPTPPIREAISPIHQARNWRVLILSMLFVTSSPYHLCRKKQQQRTSSDSSSRISSRQMM